jgi:hypothetical protein
VARYTLPEGLRASKGRLWLAAWAGVTLLSLWLTAGFPVTAIGPAALDDALFLRLAQSLLDRQWLGPFDDGTLAKGMLYPFFIAMAFLADLPLKTAQQLFYLAVCAGVARWVARRACSPALGLVLFTALAFNPLMWLPFMARVIRENIYVSLVLLVLALCSATLFRPDARAGWRGRAMLSACSGLALGCFWLTREEGPWILPCMAVLAALWLAATLRTIASPQARSGSKAAASMLLVTVLPGLLFFWLTLGTVMLANRNHYGVAETSEFHSRSFKRGYDALARIRHEQEQRYVVFPADARTKAYAHSAAARELQPFFEGAGGARWRATGCEQTRLSPCPEILAGWFMWALREAVAQAGHYRSAPEALHFYERLADEVHAACESGKIECLPRRDTLAPPFRWHYLADMGTPARVLVPFVFAMGEGSVGAEPSSGSPQQLALFRALTGSVLAPVAEPPVISGWIASASPVAELAVYDLAGKPAHTRVDYSPAPEVARLYPTLSATRFLIPTRCAVESCVLRVRAGADVLETPLRRGPYETARHELKLHIDSLKQDESPAGFAVERREQRQQRWARAIAKVYAASFPWLSLAAGLGIALALARRHVRRAHFPLVALALACFTAVVMRILLLAYLDVTSIPSGNGSYSTPVSACLILFVVLGIWLGAAAIRKPKDA